jgi:hypothetical protein
MSHAEFIIDHHHHPDGYRGVAIENPKRADSLL